jgi:hypothetical protein
VENQLAGGPQKCNPHVYPTQAYVLKGDGDIKCRFLRISVSLISTTI